MYEYEVKNIETNDHWLVYGHSEKEVKAKHPYVDWNKNIIIGRWFVD